ncbi:MAG: hypothetical protein ACOCXQ_01490 [Patescibacteria group bacterium]
MKRLARLRPKMLYNLFNRLPKRLRFVISSVIMTGLLLLTTFFEFDRVWLFAPVLILSAYITTYFAILEGINRAEWIVLFVMPVFFTIFAYFFYFLFPVRWLTRVPLIVIYGFSYYAILLTANIFNVGVEKNIQLYRAAFSVNFLLQTVIIFIAIQVILSFRQFFLINGLISFIVTFPIALQLLWSVKLKVYLERNMLFYAAIIGFFIAQASIILSFVPLKSTIFALFITSCYYSIAGLMYHYIDEKLFKQTIREYTFVVIFVSIIVLLTL